MGRKTETNPKGEAADKGRGKPRGRGNSEGAIYQRESDGRWAGAIHLGYIKGKRRRKVFYGDTRREVEQKLLKARSDRQRGLNVITERHKVGGFLESWLDGVRPTLKASTFASYAKLARKHLIPDLGRISLPDLAAQDVRAFIADKLAAGLSPRTVAYLRAILRMALAQAEEDNLVQVNVAAKVKPPRAVKHEIRPLSPEECRKLLTEAEGDRLGALYALALDSGARQGELLALHWADLDLKARRMTIRRSLSEVDGELSETTPKSASGARTIDLMPETVAALRRHREAMLAEGLAASPLVFCDSTGAPLRKSNLIRRSFVPLLERAKLERIRFHDLRHTVATNMLLAGENPRVVQERLGHASVAITLGTYSHVLPSMQREATDRLRSVLYGPGKPPR